jgi:predicted regulator of Ras-like GTPase activity (Roadblock/LC7/MglB family)
MLNPLPSPPSDSRHRRLLSSDGRLLAHACAQEDGATEEAVAAVAAAAYREYAGAAAGNFDAARLDFLLLDMEERRVAVSSVDDRFLVTLVCRPGGSAAAMRGAVEEARVALAGVVKGVGLAQARAAVRTGMLAVEAGAGSGVVGEGKGAGGGAGAGYTTRSG